MFTELDSLYAVRTTTIPNDCVCRWYQLGDSPWELLTAYSACPHHGWVDRTRLDIESVLDWLISGWIGDPPADIARDVAICRRAPGWLPIGAFSRVAERVIEHATPCWLWPIVGIIAEARPAASTWPSPERATVPLLPYPSIPEGRVLP